MDVITAAALVAERSRHRSAVYCGLPSNDADGIACTRPTGHDGYSHVAWDHSTATGNAQILAVWPVEPTTEVAAPRNLLRFPDGRDVTVDEAIVGDPAYVVAVAAHDGSTEHALGRVIGYSGSPQVLVQTPALDKVWWRADLIRPATYERVCEALTAATVDPMPF